MLSWVNGPVGSVHCITRQCKATTHNIACKQRGAMCDKKIHIFVEMENQPKKKQIELGLQATGRG